MRIGVLGVGRIGSFHANTLRDLPAVDAVVVADADPHRARDVAARLGVETTAQGAGEPGPDGPLDDLISAGIDALVIAASTAEHPRLICRGVDAGLPVFCEKPVAPTSSGTLEVVKYANGAEVQIGFQRRFDAGLLAAREAARSGAVGWVHTIRATTLDPTPPPASYIPGSGGIFRDCAVHDFDVIRWLAGQEITQVYAAGANRGEEYFRAAGDVDTASALLTLDDGTIAVVSCTRYNAAGYDVRLEVLGSKGSICAGLNDRMPLRSADPGSRIPAGPAVTQSMERFRDAYVAELAAFTEVAAGRAKSSCTLRDALETSYVAEACDLSRQRSAPVSVAEVRK